MQQPWEGPASLGTASSLHSTEGQWISLPGLHIWDFSKSSLEWDVNQLSTVPATKEKGAWYDQGLRTVILGCPRPPHPRGWVWTQLQRTSTTPLGSASFSLGDGSPEAKTHGHQFLGWVRAWEVGAGLGARDPGGLSVCGVQASLAVCSVAEAAAETSLEGGTMALAIFIPVLIISLLLGGAYIYITR